MKRIPKGLTPWAQEQVAGAERFLTLLENNVQTIKNLRKGNVLTTKNDDGVHRHRASYTVDCIAENGVYLKNIATNKSEYYPWPAFLNHETWSDNTTTTKKMRSK